MTNGDDFDFDKILDIFDQALTSTDPRVMKALRSLLTIVVLTAPDTSADQAIAVGPIRAMRDSMRKLDSRVARMEHEVRTIQSHDNYVTIGSTSDSDYDTTLFELDSIYANSVSFANLLNRTDTTPKYNTTLSKDIK